MTDAPERPGEFTILGSTQVLEHAFLRVANRSVRTPDGHIVDRVVVEHPGAVAVVPLIGDDIVLIEQYRTPADAWVLEVPAGKLDGDGEDPAQTARRELEEETGLVAGSLEHLTTIWTTVGFSDEKIGIYIATDITEGVRTPVGHEEVASRILKVPFNEALQMVRDGSIADAKTVIAILLADDYRNPA